MTRYYCPICNHCGASNAGDDPSNTPLCHICNYKIKMLPYTFPAEVRPFQPIETVQRRTLVELINIDHPEFGVLTMRWSWRRKQWERGATTVQGPIRVLWPEPEHPPTHWRSARQLGQLRPYIEGEPVVFKKVGEGPSELATLKKEDWLTIGDQTITLPPPLVAEVLQEAMAYLLENSVMSPPGSELPRQFGGYEVTLCYPSKPGEPYVVRLPNVAGRTWELRQSSWPTPVSENVQTDSSATKE